MPTVAVRLTPDQAAWLEAQTKPFRGKSDVVRDLIDSARQGLDMGFTLGGPSTAGTPSNSISSIEVTKNVNTDKKNKGRKRVDYPREFEEFWGLYQSLPVKAGKQSKPLALKEWQAACDEVRPVDLLRAVQMAMEVQHAELRSPRGFTVAMPDCFRWLRDCCYLALLEGHQTRQPELIIPGQTVL